MTRRKKIIITIGLFVLFFLLFLVWYKFTYSMDKITPYSVNEPTLDTHILIASQGSEYKNAIVSGVIDEIKSTPAFIDVMDVTSLNSIEVEEWDAILIVHTWEVWQPQADAFNFLENHYSPDRVVVHSTSGSGEEKIDGVDAISGASVIDKVPERVEEIVTRLKKIVKKE